MAGQSLTLPFLVVRTRRMKIIGIIGGVASGKSVVASRLRELGAEVLDADVVAHEVLTEPAIKAALAERFGQSIFSADGAVNRKALAQIVFAGDDAGNAALADLESIVHPRVGERLQEKTQQIKKDGVAEAIVLDAAVMMKAGWHKLCDVLIFVEVSPEMRVQRSRSRGWTDDEVASREARQTPVAEKRAAADVIIDNSGEVEDTYAEVDRLWRNITKS